MNQVQIIAARLAGAPYFTPAYRNAAGKDVSAKVEFNVYVNDGNNTDRFKITAWGMQAVRIARNGAKGKEITITGRMNSYKGKVFLPAVQGQPMQMAADGQGVPLETEKIGITLQRYHWGNDSADTIAKEIADYIQSQGQMGRPTYWCNPDTQDNAVWKSICAGRNAAQYQQGQPSFGYAIVQNIPANATPLAIEYREMGQAAGGAATAANPNPAPVNTAGGQVVYENTNMGQPLPVETGTAVQHIANPAAVHQVVTPQTTTVAAQPAPGAYVAPQPATTAVAQPAAVTVAAQPQPTNARPLG